YGESAKAVWFRIGQAASAAEPRPGQDGDQEDGLRAALDIGFHAVPDRGVGGQARPVAALRQAPAAPVVAGAAAASAGNGVHRWPAPPFGEPCYNELLTSTVESARAAVSADAAYAMVPDEDGELRLRAAVGRFPAPTVATTPAGAGPAGVEGQARKGTPTAQGPRAADARPGRQHRS